MACKSTGEKVFTVVNITLLVLLCVCFLLPMFIVLMQSFLSQDEISRRGTFILIPEVFDAAAYRMILSKGSSIFNAYGVTIMRVAAAPPPSCFSPARWLTRSRKTTCPAAGWSSR